MTAARAAGATSAKAAVAHPPSAATPVASVTGSADLAAPSVVSVAVSPRPSSPSASSADFPPDVVRLLDVLARIERRRQARLAAERAQASSVSAPVAVSSVAKQARQEGR